MQLKRWRRSRERRKNIAILIAGLLIAGLLIVSNRSFRFYSNTTLSCKKDSGTKLTAYLSIAKN